MVYEENTEYCSKLVPIEKSDVFVANATTYTTAETE